MTAQRSADLENAFAAAQGGDTGALIELLSDDVVACGDSGDKTPTFQSPVHGREAVVEFSGG